ncbi:hypothetical protein OIE61_38870 [Streptomyces sp. NBC_01762]|uniref:hypothetical protein n=1 Tax=Streptomyces sp. NBC_01762 TaxID=2975933 RepID=UPI002DDC78B2|nr:hypothetical protein [Streptomyces sp. NBC_01762]WSC49406.1 hypothetical protein OIE61_38870 [Streptomyces sp. NBC_01762]
MIRLEPTPESAAFRKEVRTFVAECSTGIKKHAGVDVRPMREITTSAFNEGLVDGVRIPAANVIGKVNADWRAAMSSLGHEHSGVAVHGVELFAALDVLLRLAVRTSVGGRPALDGSAPPAGGRRACHPGAREDGRPCPVADTAPRRKRPADAPPDKIFCGEPHHDLTAYAVRLPGTEGLFTEGDADAETVWWQDAHPYSRM